MKLLKPSWIHHDGHSIFSIDIHPDDTHFATGGQGDDNTGRVVIWNLKAVLSDARNDLPKLLCQLDHHNACVNCVRWSNSGKFLASGGDDKVIMIWKLVSKCGGNGIGNSVFEKEKLEIWKSVSILRGHDGDVLDLAWSPGDSYLATCSIDNSIKIWDAQNFPQVLATLQGHTSMVKGVTWDPIGKYLATQSVDKTLRIWRTSDWCLEQVVQEPFTDCGGTTHVLRCDWSADGMYLVSAHAMNYGFPTAQIIERDGWKIDKDFVGHRKAVVCVRFSHKIHEHNRVKQCCVAMGSRDRSISVWSTALRRPVVVVKDAFTSSVLDISWSYCGKLLLACSNDGSVMAVQFSYKEIGRPLSQEDTDSVLQKYYGQSSVSLNKLSIVPNMEVFLARNAKEKEEIEKRKVPPTPKEPLQPPKEIIPPQPQPPPPAKVRGPTTQIETRTADGKRRITPKFLPLPSEENLPVVREDCPAFSNSDGNTAALKGENLRENMVSNIDDVSFPENQNAAVPEPTLDGKKGEEEGQGQPTPMEVEDANPVVNGFSSPNGEKVNGLVNGTREGESLANGTATATTNGESGSQGTEKDAQAEKTKAVSTPPVNMIQVKRKASADVTKTTPTPMVKKKFTPQSLRTFPAKKGEESPAAVEVKNTSPIANRIAVGPVMKNASSKMRLAPMKIEGSLAIQVNTKPESAYSLEANNNNKIATTVCHTIKCKHSSTSVQGLEWTVCTDSPICGMSGDMFRIVAVCEDATVHVLDLKGRYAISPFVLSGYPSRIVQNGPLLLVVTVKGILHLWNIHIKSVVIKSESLVPILNQPGSSHEDKTVDVSNAFIAAGGVPVICLTNGKSFMYNKQMCTWSLYSDSTGLVSSPLMLDAGEPFSSLSKVGRRRKPEQAALSHIKLQLIRAIELEKPASIQQWVVVLGKTLASQGLEKELHILCEDLLGPTHSSARPGVSWNPKLATVEKRPLLREILNCLLEDLRWQDFYCEFDELLREVEEQQTS